MAASGVATGRHAERVLSVGLLTLLIGLLAVVVARTAWVSDDAYITFRTIDNALHGYGLRWNVAERVQSFTHPLWLLLLTPVVGLTGNPYLSALALSALLTAGTVGLVLAGARGGAWQRSGLVAAMVLSKAFTDYSTSGLENSLSHALLAQLMLLTAARVESPRRAAAAGLLVGLAGMARVDLLLLAGPIGLASLRRLKRTVPAFIAGLAPLALWELFSIVYYGVPFPNTAYAKLATGVAQRDLWMQGLTYFLDSLDRDPVTLFVIAGATLAAGASGGLGRLRAMAVVVYLVYVGRIGGDFMSGRFLTAPFVVSLCLWGRLSWPEARPAQAALLAATLAFGLAVPQPTFRSGPGYQAPWTVILSDSGVVDERGYYFQHTGWWGQHGLRSEPVERELLASRIASARATHPRAFVYGAVGMVGYYTGPDRYIVDVFGLCDPLLARLPAKVPWRIGHFEREPPAGYLESVAEDRNLVQSPPAASLYEVIRLVTRGPIWSARRWRAIVALNTGQTDGWGDE